MDYIIKYLSNPLKIGVYNTQFLIDLSKLEKLFRDIATYARKRKMKSARFIKMADEIKKSERYPFRDMIEKLDEAIKSLAMFDECPEEIPKYFGIDPSRLKSIPPAYRGRIPSRNCLSTSVL